MQEQPNAEEDTEGHNNQNRGQHERRGEIRFHSGIDRQRHGLGSTNEITGKHDGCAKLAQSACPRHHRATKQRG